MSKILLYPKCAKTFIDFCHSEKHLTNKFVNKLRKLKPFDVTLRDGLQGLSKEQQLTMKPVDMLNLYFQIKEKYQPGNMEIGSIVSSKVLPIFKNSDTFTIILNIVN